MPGAADSAGVPWEGRSFTPNPSAGDDGSADPRLLEALRRFRAAEAGAADVVDAVRSARLLIPLVAHAGEEGVDEHGRRFEKKQELAIVTVAGPDGRKVLPAFTSVAAMSEWNPSARPVPADGTRVALAAAGEHTELVVLDPTSETEFALRRPAVWAIAREIPWTPSYEDSAVAEALGRAATGEDAVVAVQAEAGDPTARLAGPELMVRLTLVPGLHREQLDALLRRLGERWATDAVVAERVDSLGIRLAAAR